MKKHLRNKKTGMGAITPSCFAGQSAHSSTPLVVSPEVFYRAMQDGEACKHCEKIFNARREKALES